MGFQLAIVKIQERGVTKIGVQQRACGTAVEHRWNIGECDIGVISHGKHEVNFLWALCLQLTVWCHLMGPNNLEGLHKLYFQISGTGWLLFRPILGASLISLSLTPLLLAALKIHHRHQIERRHRY